MLLHFYFLLLLAEEEYFIFFWDSSLYLFRFLHYISYVSYTLSCTSHTFSLCDSFWIFPIDLFSRSWILYFAVSNLLLNSVGFAITLFFKKYDKIDHLNYFKCTDQQCEVHWLWKTNLQSCFQSCETETLYSLNNSPPKINK